MRPIVRTVDQTGLRGCRRLDEQAKTLHKLEGTLEGVNDTSRLILEALLKGEKS